MVRCGNYSNTISDYINGGRVVVDPAQWLTKLSYTMNNSDKLKDLGRILLIEGTLKSSMHSFGLGYLNGIDSQVEKDVHLNMYNKYFIPWIRKKCTKLFNQRDLYQISIDNYSDNFIGGNAELEQNTWNGDKNLRFIENITYYIENYFTNNNKYKLDNANRLSTSTAGWGQFLFYNLSMFPINYRYTTSGTGATTSSTWYNVSNFTEQYIDPLKPVTKSKIIGGEGLDKYAYLYYILRSCIKYDWYLLHRYTNFVLLQSTGNTSDPVGAMRTYGTDRLASFHWDNWSFHNNLNYLELTNNYINPFKYSILNRITYPSKNPVEYLYAKISFNVPFYSFESSERGYLAITYCTFFFYFNNDEKVNSYSLIKSTSDYPQAGGDPSYILEKVYRMDSIGGRNASMCNLLLTWISNNYFPFIFDFPYNIKKYTHTSVGEAWSYGHVDESCKDVEYDLSLLDKIINNFKDDFYKNNTYTT